VKSKSNAGQLPHGLLKLSIFATGLSGIIAEYSLSTLASWFIGNAVVQFTIVVSLMLFAMGVGSRLSRLYHRNLLDSFIRIELLLSLLSGASSAAVYGSQSFATWTPILLYGLALAIGLLIGLEIPLVMRIAERDTRLSENVSQVLANDYIGSLFGGLIFAFFALPKLGMTWTPPVFASVNLLIALLLVWKARALLEKPRQTSIQAIMAGLAFILMLTVIKPITVYGEQLRYRDKIIYADQSPYQRIVLTEFRDIYWFYLNGKLQLSSFDEWRYHETMVHPIMLAAPRQNNILILGGGDGCLARELLRYEDLESITIVDIDPAVTHLWSEHQILNKINNNSLSDSRVKILNRDAMIFVADCKEMFDLIFVDLPDPSSLDICRLYSVEFYSELHSLLSPGGFISTQATSPIFSPEAFVCIQKTMLASGLQCGAWHTHVPTMGEWGWVYGQRAPYISNDLFYKNISESEKIPKGLKFYNAQVSRALFKFGTDTYADSSNVLINRIGDPLLLGYYRNSFWDIE
jgi:spermidine synthase